MRESIGGTMLFWIVLFFLTLFTFFLAFVIKYAHVYKMKNTVINYIERREGIETTQEFRTELDSLGYPSKSAALICKNEQIIGGELYGAFYTVELHADLTIPLIYLAVPVRISGETRTITTGVTINSTSSNIPKCSELQE